VIDRKEKKMNVVEVTKKFSSDRLALAKEIKEILESFGYLVDDWQGPDLIYAVQRVAEKAGHEW